MNFKWEDLKLNQVYRCHYQGITCIFMVIYMCPHHDVKTENDVGVLWISSDVDEGVALGKDSFMEDFEEFGHTIERVPEADNILWNISEKLIDKLN